MPLIYIDRRNLERPQEQFERMLRFGKDHAIEELRAIIERYRDGLVLPGDQEAFERYVTAAEIELARLEAE